MTKAIYFDMDGTIADLYAVENWLPKLRAEDASPYMEAKPLVNLSILARYLNKLSREGYAIGIVSWGSKNCSEAYLAEIVEAKMAWLNRHLKSVHFDEIAIVPYGTPKSTAVSLSGILFDDEQRNRDEWHGIAHDVDDIIGVLKSLL